MDTSNMIEITGVDLVDVVKAAYNLSHPQGLGLLHYVGGGLSDEQASLCITEDRQMPVSMDYVLGRSCKFRVFKDESKRLWINKSWYDHTPGQLCELLKIINVEIPVEMKGYDYDHE